MNYDSHCHLDSINIDNLNRAVKNNISTLAVAMDYKSSIKILELSKTYNKYVKAFLGLHPEVNVDNLEIEMVLGLIDKHHNEISGIGEVGIPFFYLDKYTKEEKNKIKDNASKVLDAFVERASRYNLPLNLHVVEDDIEYALPILEKYSIKGALFHWYEGSLDNLNRLVDKGHFVSVSPWIFVEEHYQEFVKNIPLNNLLLESDGPCEYNKTKGYPSMILDIARYLAIHHKIQLNEFLSIVEYNTLRFLRESH